jgi:hypothetical protein
MLFAVSILAACEGEGPSGIISGLKLVSLSPSTNATNVAQSATVSATFAEPVDPGTVNTTTLVVTQAEGFPIAGTVTVDGRVITFTPSRALDPRTTFTAHLAEEVLDLDGDVMSSGATWTFSTVASPPPEHVSPLVQVGVTVNGERIESDGDIDEFHLRGTAGAEWVVFAQSGPEDLSSITLTVHDSLTDDLVAEFITHSETVELEEWSSGRFVLPNAGPYIVRVTGNAEATYAFRLDAVNRAPETTSASYAIGETVAEAIGTVGDIDEFSFQGTVGQEVNILVQLVAAMEHELSVEVYYDGSRVIDLGTSTATEVLGDFGSGRTTLPGTGTYLVRVSSEPWGPRAQSTGSYRFSISPIDRRAENGAVVALDAAPITGAIDSPGDVDEYELSGTAGQLVVLHLTTTGTRGGSLLAQLLGADGTQFGTVVTGGSSSGSGLQYGRRRELPYTGTFRLRVQGLVEWGQASGPYTIEAYTVSAAPEHVPSRIALGESVTAERIDRPGDLDVFTFVGEAGRDVNVFLGWEETNAELFAHVGFGIFTRPGTLALDGQSTGRFRVKDSTYTVTVDPHWSAQDHMMHSQGAYALRVFPIDPRPEGRPTAYVLGDMVSIEPLYPAGDVDDYVFELTEETIVDILWEPPADGGPVQALLLGDRVLDRALWGGFPRGDRPPGPQIHRVTLPADRYRLSVSSPNATPFGDQSWPKAPTLQYRFAISRYAPP